MRTPGGATARHGLGAHEERARAAGCRVRAGERSEGAGLRRIRVAVRRGYVVRTRADADTREARAGDTARRRAAFASGAQWVSTDFPAPGMAARFGSAYEVRLPGHRPARCNPVTAPPGCRAGWLDRAR
jgi:hypothetical protein